MSNKNTVYGLMKLREHALFYPGVKQAAGVGYNRLIF